RGLQSTVHIELRDVDAKLIAQFDGRYRHGFLFETADGLSSDETRSPLALEYLLHGNVLNRLVGRIFATRTDPLAALLSKATLFSHPQGGAASSVRAELEVLEQKDYDPVWVLRSDANAGVTWAQLSWDKERAARCDTLLKPERTGAPLMQ